MPWRTLSVLLVALATSGAQVPQFDVASVKLVKEPAGPHGVSLIIDHGKLTIEAGELRQIIGLAYGIQRILVQGGPDWCDADQFDIVAKAEKPDATRDEIRPMLQALLADRFKLVTHRATKEMQGYTLVVAKGGPKLAVARDESGPINVFTFHDRGLRFGNMALTGLVNYLANVSGQPVRDGTGLTGRYNFDLEYRTAEVGRDAAGHPVLDTAGMIFAAVEEQLGLKVQAGKGPTDILVIDRAEHPSEN